MKIANYYKIYINDPNKGYLTRKFYMHVLQFLAHEHGIKKADIVDDGYCVRVYCTQQKLNKVIFDLICFGFSEYAFILDYNSYSSRSPRKSILENVVRPLMPVLTWHNLGATLRRTADAMADDLNRIARAFSNVKITPPNMIEM